MTTRGSARFEVILITIFGVAGILEAAEPSRDQRVAFGGSLRIEAGEVVENAVAVGGSVTVKGRVEHNAVAVGGSVILEDGAEVDGNAVAVGGKIDVAPGAKLGGDRVSMGALVGKGFKSFAAPFMAGFFADKVLKFLCVVTKIARAIALLVLGLILIAIWPKRIERTGRYMASKPLLSFLAGLGIAVVLAPLLLTFLLTIVGIPLIPLTVFAVVCLVVFGAVSFAAWLGGGLLRTQEKPVAAFLLGVLILLVVQFIPFLGTGIMILIAMISAGAGLLSRFGSRPKEAAV